MEPEDYAIYLAGEARSDVAAYHQFRLLYDETRADRHFFFEGDEDSLFYMPFARKYLGGSVAHTYDCGGKNGVVNVRKWIISDGYDTKVCLYFVDRDFDDFLNCQIENDDRTYVTDFYSIENELSVSESVEIILVDFIRISRTDAEFVNVRDNTLNALNSFYATVRPLMAWIIAAKHCGCSPNLANKNALKDVIEIQPGTAGRKQAGFEVFRNKVLNGGRMPPLSSVIYWRRRLDIDEAKLWVRGKYDLWCFRLALVAAVEAASARRKLAGGKSYRISSPIRDGHLFDVLGGRIRPPQTLTVFLSQRL